MNLFDYGMILAGLLIISFTLLRRIAKRREKQSVQNERPHSHNRPHPHNRPSPLTTRAENLILQLETMSREINAQLDLKMKTLETLLEDADSKITELNNAGASPENRKDPTSLPPPPTIEERYKRIFDLADSGKTASEICDQTGMLRGEVELIIGLRKSKQHGTDKI